MKLAEKLQKLATNAVSATAELEEAKAVLAAFPDAYDSEETGYVSSAAFEHAVGFEVKFSADLDRIRLVPYTEIAFVASTGPRNVRVYARRSLTENPRGQDGAVRRLFDALCAGKVFGPEVTAMVLEAIKAQEAAQASARAAEPET